MIRVGIEGSDDAATFWNRKGVWIGEDCEPVRLEFAWQSRERREKVSEADCICSKELAAHLIHLLWNGEAETAPGMASSLPVYRRTTTSPIPNSLGPVLVFSASNNR